eukprot:COSAG04_NODE_20635_length_389_cov_1.065517_1_plen_53_part_10
MGFTPAMRRAQNRGWSVRPARRRGRPQEEGPAIYVRPPRLWSRRQAPPVQRAQ